MSIKTLNEIAHLKNSTFGKPHPRHGLKLLYWFAHDCVYSEDDQPYLEYDPSNGDFGFKDFHNNEGLLPNQDNPYYKVGNLNSNRGSELPKYVQENYDSEQDITNADRLIICLDDDNEWLDRIYVTRHHGQRTFDQSNTYRISKGLLKIISDFSNLRDFLNAVGYVAIQRPAESYITIPEERSPTPSQRSPPQRRSFWDSCTIL